MIWMGVLPIHISIIHHGLPSWQRLGQIVFDFSQIVRKAVSKRAVGSNLKNSILGTATSTSAQLLSPAGKRI